MCQSEVRLNVTYINCFQNQLITSYYISSVKIMTKYNKGDFQFVLYTLFVYVQYMTLKSLHFSANAEMLRRN